MSVVHAFGFTQVPEAGKEGQPLHNNIGMTFLDETKILYSVGRHCVSQDVESGAMTFMPHPPGVERVMSVAAAPGKKLVAVCEKVVSSSTSMAQVSVYQAGTKAAKPKLMATLQEVSGNWRCGGEVK
jgi:hypothetical protein